MIITNISKKKILANKLKIAHSLPSRLIGLIGKKSFSEGEGLLIKKSGNSIHTFFMNFPIDLLFIDKNGCVRSLKENVLPWKIVLSPLFVLGFENTDCLELPAGIIHKTSTCLGDLIRVET